MRVTLIAAVSSDGFISRGRGIAWHLPEDVQQFREYCEEKWLIAGRRTFEEMRGWFRPGQTPVVVTRQQHYEVQGGHAAESLDAALKLARRAGAEECVVIGGGEIYAAAMPFAGTLILTRVETRLHEGIPFPPVAEAEWRTISLRHFTADEAHAFPFTIRCMERTAGQLLPDQSYAAS